MKLLSIFVVVLSTFLATALLSYSNNDLGERIAKAPLKEIEDTPLGHINASVEYLESHIKDAPYIRFLSDPAGEVDDNKILNWTINHLHLESTVSDITPIAQRLWIIDIRDYGWSPGAFSAVARRETYYREPLPGVSTNLALKLRTLTQTVQDPDTLHLEAIVRADWFFRETMEADRSPSYYDLLFAKFRFKEDHIVEKKVISREYWPGGEDKGVYYKEGYYDVERTIKTREAIFVKFPKDEADFESVFGVDKARAFIKKTKINAQHGAVVEGGEKGQSIVARQNRLIEFTQGFFGPYYKTYDVKETTGKRDFTEQLNKDFEFDAGEILTDTPSGALAALLVVKDGNIVDVADNRFATDKSDIKLDARVRTPGSCFICHETGYIEPENMVKELLKARIDLRFFNKQDERDARSFFLNWEHKLKYHQTGHTLLAKRLSGYEPAKRALVFKAYRDRYDAPVDLKKAIAETGLTPRTFELCANLSAKTRVKTLITGMTMARKTWEVDGYKEIMLQHARIEKTRIEERGNQK